MTLTAISDSIVDELVAILGPEGVLTSAGPLQPDPGAGAIPLSRNGPSTCPTRPPCHGPPSR